MKAALSIVSLGICLVLSQVVHAETGDLKIRFEYAGSPFEPQPIDVNKDKEFCGKFPLVNEKLIVNKDNKGIQNVIVYVYTGRGGSDLPEFPASDKTHELANLNCRFEPHIVIAQKGDTLKITNPDTVGHNANISFFKNEPVNLTIPPQQFKDVELKEAEPAPIPVACNIHPWMLAHVLVLDHPFAAKSDENGELVIKGLPAGKLTFRAFAEAGSIKEVIIDGKKESWRSSRFDVEIKPGMNDMGTVVIPSDALSAN